MDCLALRGQARRGKPAVGIVGLAGYQTRLLQLGNRPTDLNLVHVGSGTNVVGGHRLVAAKHGHASSMGAPSDSFPFLIFLSCFY
jgi:hypothetical protein